jgi:hypothetical protein
MPANFSCLEYIYMGDIYLFIPGTVLGSRSPFRKCGPQDIMRRTGLNPATDEEIHQDFRVRRPVVEQWLKYLEAHHPTFRSRQVNIDWERLSQLPLDASVHARLRTIVAQNLPEPNQDVGPPQEGQNPAKC